MYVAVKGGERAIDNAHAWLAEERRGDTSVAELGVAQIRGRAFAARLRRAGPPVLAAALLAAAAAAYLGPEGVAFMTIADW